MECLEALASRAKIKSISILSLSDNIFTAFDCVEVAKNGNTGEVITTRVANLENQLYGFTEENYSTLFTDPD